MPFSPKTLEEKPYNACITCAFIGKSCDGPNFLAMSIERWCEWCRLRKDYLDWTNAYVAERADVAKVSVDRIMSGNVKDLRISTMQAVTKALVNGTWGQYPCAMAGIGEDHTVYVDNPVLVEKADHAQAECKRLQQEIAVVREEGQRKIDFLKEQVKFKEEQMNGKDRLLSERYEFMKRKDKAIWTLSVLLGVAVAIIVAALIIDRLHSGIGFFWLEGLLDKKSVMETLRSIISKIA